MDVTMHIEIRNHRFRSGFFKPNYSKGASAFILQIII